MGVFTALAAQGKMPQETAAESWERDGRWGKSQGICLPFVLSVCCCLLKPWGLAEAASSCQCAGPALLQAPCRQ